jgi:glycosyl transferase family 25
MKAFIISLSKIQSSKDSGVEAQQALKRIGIDSELFEGTYGNDAVDIFEKENRVLKDISGVNSNTGKFLYPGVKGCFYSHYRLWQKCVELNEPIMIFEDDLVVYREYKDIKFTDLLILSINYDWMPCESLKDLLEKDNAETSAQHYRWRFLPGASGYILSPTAAAKLVEAYISSYLPADVAINSDLLSLQIHPQLIARSKTMAEKESMTRKKYW